MSKAAPADEDAAARRRSSVMKLPDNVRKKKSDPLLQKEQMNKASPVVPVAALVVQLYMLLVLRQQPVNLVR